MAGHHLLVRYNEQPPTLRPAKVMAGHHLLVRYNFDSGQNLLIAVMAGHHLLVRYNRCGFIFLKYRDKITSIFN